MELSVYLLKGKLAPSYHWTRDRYVVAPSSTHAVACFNAAMAQEYVGETRYGCGDGPFHFDSVHLVGRVAVQWKPPQVTPHGPTIDQIAAAEVEAALA